MSNKYALIDLENVQPTSLQKLKNEGYQLKVFVGANQAKISVELAEEIQRFGEGAQYVRLQNSGKNALDFHIAFYMGQLVSSDAGCQFLVISKDTGYDPLLKHMRSMGIKANRSAAVVSSQATTQTSTQSAPSKKSFMSKDKKEKDKKKKKKKKECCEQYKKGKQCKRCPLEKMCKK